MQQDFDMLSEDDLALVTALQMAPRATWAELSKALGVSAATVSRHWERLSAQGIAWVTASPGQAIWSAGCIAYVEVRCAPGCTSEVARTLAQDPHALTVEITTGGADLFLTVAATEIAALSRYLLERIDVIPGVSRTRTRISTGLYRDGSGWRLDGLPVSGPSTLTRRLPPPEPLGVAPGHPTAVDRSLFVQLGLDGRSTYADLAARAGVSEVTARRRTAYLVRTGALVLRTEVAAHRVGWPISAVLCFEVPTDRLSEAARAAARHRQIRMSVTVADSPSLVVAAWLRRVDQIHEIEHALVAKVPQMAVSRRLIVLRTIKRMGRILDEHGHAIDAVPMDHWQPPVTRTAC